MSKMALVTLFAVLVCVSAYGQKPDTTCEVDTAWVRTYNGPGNLYDYAYDIATDASGNVYVTGSAFFSHSDYTTIKYHPDGDTAWLRSYNGLANHIDEAYAIAVDNSGCVCITGLTYATVTHTDYATVKYHPDGDTAWVRLYDGTGSFDWANAVAVDSSGNIYVTGLSVGGSSAEDYLTIKYDQSGSELWVGRYDGPGSDQDQAKDITVDILGNVYVTGSSYGSGTYYDYATVKYYPDGDTAWVRRYNGPGGSSDAANAISVDDIGNVYVTGSSRGSGTSDDYATIKYYPNGDTAWVRRYDGPAHNKDVALDLKIDDSGNVYVTGRSVQSEYPDSNSDYATIKYYSNGDTAWVRRYNGPGNSWDGATALAVDALGNVYVTGFSYCRDVYEQYVTIRYNADGSIGWVRSDTGGFNRSKPDLTPSIAIDAAVNVYITGVTPPSSEWSSDYNYLTIKYTQVCGALPIVIAGPDVNEDGIHDDSPFAFNQTISFQGQVFHPDSLEGATIDSTKWEFDDGASVKDQVDVQHQYTNLFGEHSAILWAWDNRGNRVSDTLHVLIDSGGPPEAVAGPDTDPEDGTHDDSPFEFNEIISFVGVAYAEEGKTIDSTRWYFDDGVSVKDQLEITHQYADLAGEHAAILWAWDNSGLSASDTLRVWIEQPPQVHSISALYDGVSHADTIGTFISGFDAQNSFYASVTIGDFPLDSVIFELGGIRIEGVEQGEKSSWRADFSDIGFLPEGDNTLRVIAYDAGEYSSENTAVVKMRGTPSWYGGQWLSQMPYNSSYQFVTDDGIPYYQMEISIPEPPVEWGPYNFGIPPFFPDLSNHFKIFLGIQGRFHINGSWSGHQVDGSLIAKLLGKGLDENISANQGELSFGGPYNDLVGVTIYDKDFEITNQTLFSTEGTLVTFWIWWIKIDIKYSAAFGLSAHIGFGAHLSVDPGHPSYWTLTPGIEPWVSLDIWASVLFGVAQVGMNFTPTFGLEFPCTLYVYPTWNATANQCTYFVLHYSVWASVLWVFRGTLYEGSGFQTDYPPGCHWGKYGLETEECAAVIETTHQNFPQVFETPHAAVDPNSEQSMIVWIRDEYAADTALVNPEVYYGYYDGAEWTFGTITDNDRWETNPKAAFLSSNKVVVVWTQNEIPEADCDETVDINDALSNQELYYSVWNISSKSWTEAVRITTNSVPDGCVDLDGGLGKAIMAWVRDPDGDANTRDDWEVYYSWYDGSVWTGPENLSNLPGSDLEPAVALDDSTGQAMVVWTHEEDGDFNSPADRSIFYQYISFSKGPGVLGTDLPCELGPLSPSVAFGPHSNPIIAYTSRGVKWDSTSSSWDTLGVGIEDKLWFCYQQAKTWGSAQVVIEEQEVAAANPIVKVDNENRAMIVYRGFEGGGIADFDGEIFSVAVDLNSPSPQADHLVQYTSDSTTTWMPAFDLNSQGEGRLIYVNYEANPEDTLLNGVCVETPSWTWVPEDGRDEKVILSFTLDQNYPNPFNPQTVIRYSLKYSADVKLKIYNVRGQLVKTLVDDHVTSGTHRVEWDGEDDRGIAAASGMYFCQLKVGHQTVTRKLVKIK